MSSLHAALGALLDAFTPALQHLLALLLPLVPPAWLLALLLAGVNIFVFHATLAHEGRSLLVLAAVGLFGFALGNFLAATLQSPLPMLGDLHAIEASTGAWLVLSVANAWPAGPAGD
jgi:hypothetical protein